MKYEKGCQQWYDDEIIDPLCHQNLSIPTFEPQAIPGGQPPIEEFHKKIGYAYPAKINPWKGEND